MRKKMHVAEFQEMGFEFTAKFTHGLQQDEFFNFTHQFIQLIEANNLAWGGGGDVNKIGGFISAFNRGTVTSQQQRTVGDWLRLQNEVAEVGLQPLKDCWYGGVEE